MYGEVTPYTNQHDIGTLKFHSCYCLLFDRQEDVVLDCVWNSDSV